eukprot:Platyproteum_vivax@DN4219_c0_g1_i2.p1
MLPKVVLWIVRHGERADESASDSEQFFQETARSSLFDPPLTACGNRQAEVAAIQLKTFMTDSSLGLKFKRVYSSPLLRSVQTAEVIASALDLSLQVVAGLSSCCAAVERYGLATLMPRMHVFQKDYKGNAEHDKPNLEDLSFIDCLRVVIAREASEAIGGAPIHLLVVAHREATHDLLHTYRPSEIEKLMVFRHVPYCCISVFSAEMYALSSATLSASDTKCTRPMSRSRSGSVRKVTAQNVPRPSDHCPVFKCLELFEYSPLLSEELAYRLHKLNYGSAFGMQSTLHLIMRPAKVSHNFKEERRGRRRSRERTKKESRSLQDRRVSKRRRRAKELHAECEV